MKRGTEPFGYLREQHFRWREQHSRQREEHVNSFEAGAMLGMLEIVGLSLEFSVQGKRALRN